MLFGTENYFESRDMLEEALAIIDTRRTEAALREGVRSTPGDVVLQMVLDNKEVVVPLLILLAGGYLASRKIRANAVLRKRLGMLEREKQSLMGMMKKLQERYFGSGSMGRSDYETMIERYRKGMVRVEKDIMLLKEILGKKA